LIFEIEELLKANPGKTYSIKEITKQFKTSTNIATSRLNKLWEKSNTDIHKIYLPIKKNSSKPRVLFYYSNLISDSCSNCGYTDFRPGNRILDEYGVPTSNYEPIPFRKTFQDTDVMVICPNCSHHHSITAWGP